MGEVVCAQADAGRYDASKFPKLVDADLERIDQAVAALEAMNLRFDGWATPGGNLPAAALDLARTAARRAERRVVSLPTQGRTLRPLVGRYVNRVADLLWLLAREAEKSGPS
jgi:cob(I)alamin adenosyltransferase